MQIPAHITHISLSVLLSKTKKCSSARDESQAPERGWGCSVGAAEAEGQEDDGEDHGEGRPRHVSLDHGSPRSFQVAWGMDDC